MYTHRVNILVALLTTLVPSLFLAASALAACIRPASMKPSAMAAHAVLTAGIGLFLNVVYPWFRVGWLPRAATVGLYLAASLLFALARFRCMAGARHRLVRPSRPAPQDLVWLAGGSLLIAAWLAIAFWPVTPQVALASPLAQGTWYVAVGGPIALGNHHQAVPEQRHAIDLVRVGSSGRSWSGNPAALQSYLAWGSPVVSPSPGVVVAVVDGLPDLPIGERDGANPAGNHVVLETADGLRILLAHLRQGSIGVEVGQRVQARELIGEVGNSGNTSEPHLHIQVMRQAAGGPAWVGIPAAFESMLLRRGHVLRAGQ